MVVEVNPNYDSIGQDLKINPPGPKQTPKLDPEDPENLYSLVGN